MSKVIVIASGKGGSGTTTFTVNLGIVLANTGAKVLICDMNIGLRNDDIYLGTENRVLFDMGDYVEGICSLEKAIIPTDANDDLYLLSCPQGKGIPGFNEEAVSRMFAELKGSFDYILVDCPVRADRFQDCVYVQADSALLVTVSDFVCIRNTDAVSRKMESRGLRNRYFVINMVREETFGQEPTLEWINQTMELPLTGILPYDEEIHRSNNKGIPVVQTGSSYYVKMFIEIAARIVA